MKQGFIKLKDGVIGRYSTVQQEVSGRYSTVLQEVSGRYHGNFWNFKNIVFDPTHLLASLVRPLNCRIFIPNLNGHWELASQSLLQNGFHSHCATET